MMSSSDEDDPELETLDISNDHFYIRPTKRQATKKQWEVRRKIRDEIQIKNLSYSGMVSSANVPKYGSKTIRHSIPAYDLWRPFFPTYLSEDKFRNFHRPKLRHYKNGPQAMFSGRRIPEEFPIKSLTRHIFKEQRRLRLKIIKAIDSGVSRETIVSELLRINKAKDLTAKSGEIYLFEYCEENPPVLSQIGMASNIKDYIIPVTLDKPRTPSSASSDDTRLSQAACVTSIPQQPIIETIGFEEKIAPPKKVYFSQPKPGSKFKVIENNLYRAPIFGHELSTRDFLIIRTRNSFYIRPANSIFTVGQTMPIVAIPPPTENNIQKFRCDLSNVYIHRLFKESGTKPASLMIEKLSKLFPDYNLTVLKRRLKINGAEKVRSLKHSAENLFCRGSSNYGLVNLLELRRLLSPEQYCLHMTTLAARQRLRELNYSESMICPTSEAELELEVLAAPWNTSRAILSTMAGKCYLDLKRHLIDPTGIACEGFSCVPWSRSPTEDEQLIEMKTIPASGTFQFQEKNPMAHKIRAEKLERLEIYKNEADMLATVQAKVLASHESVSSSEDEDDDQEDSENMDVDLNQQLRDLDRLVVDHRTIGEVHFENEEEERRKLLVEMRVNGSSGQNSSNHLLHQSGIKDASGSLSSQTFNMESIKDKILMITRTYKTARGEIQRTEVVREPRIIALYVKSKGGSLNSFQPATPNGSSQGINRQSCGVENSVLSSQSVSSQPLRRRSCSNSLGPSELCRADGVTLTISKKVLENIRPTRRCRRQSMASQ